MTESRHAGLALRGRGLRPEPMLWVLLGVGATLAMLWGFTWNVQLNDYASEAAPSLTLLLHGRIASFLADAPSYGGSLVLRAPFALPGSLAGGGALLIYRLAALPCLLVIGTLGIWLARELRRLGGGPLAAVAAVVLCAANPITYRALQIGHPEEPLGAALCVIAVLLALRGRANWAGVVLALAIVNKQWALLAVGPVVLALPAHRWRTLVIAAAVTAGFELPMMLSSPTVKAGTSRLTVADTGYYFHPWQVFWFFGPLGHWVPSMGPAILKGFRTAPDWLGGRAHLLIVWLGLPLTLFAMFRRTPRESALLLLALLMLMRCWLDPWDVVYYPLPFIIALLSWEVAIARRFPLGAVAATAATWAIFQVGLHHLHPDGQALSFLVPATLALAALAAAIYLPRPAYRRRRSARALSRADAGRERQVEAAV